MAAREAQKDVVELLLEKGADADAKDQASFVCCGWGRGGGDAQWDMVLDVHGMRLHKHGIALNVVHMLNQRGAWAC